MYYDVGGRPEPGSLLESVLMIVANRRQEAEFLKSLALVKASTKDESLGDTLKLYSDTVFPYLEGQKKRKEMDAKEALKQWTAHRALKVQPLYRPSGNRAVVSKLRRGAERLKRSEEERRSKKHWRIG